MKINNLFDITDKKILVTGSSQGNGFTIAKSLIQNKAKVIATDKNITNLNKAFSQSKNNKLMSHNIDLFAADLADSKSINSLCKYIKKNHKDLSCIINNAGITISNELHKYSENDWDLTYKVNLKAPFQIIKNLSLLLKKNYKSNPSIINITSLNSTLAFPNNPAYMSFKGGLSQLTKSVANDLGKFNIRCNSVSPGYIITNMTKKSYSSTNKKKLIASKTMFNRWGKSEDLIGTIIFLLSDASNYITAQNIFVDGGWSSKGI